VVKAKQDIHIELILDTDGFWWRNNIRGTTGSHFWSITIN